MRIDASQSEYHEAESASREFEPDELTHARLLLRRLRFLEVQVRKNGGLASPDGGAGWAEMERNALAWALGPEGIGFLSEDKTPTGARQ